MRYISHIDNWSTTLLLIEIITCTAEFYHLVDETPPYCSYFEHCVFEPPFGEGGGLGTTYDVHLGLIGKREVDFILVLIKVIFARCYIRLRRYERNSAISLQRGQFDSKFQVEGDVPHQSFLHG